MIKKSIGQILPIGIGILLIAIALESCMVFMGHHTPVIVIDPVCGMKVDKSEAYEWKYNETKYYFDTYNCKETFKMHPEIFLAKNNCDNK